MKKWLELAVDLFILFFARAFGMLIVSFLSACVAVFMFSLWNHTGKVWWGDQYSMNFWGGLVIGIWCVEVARTHYYDSMPRTDRKWIVFSETLVTTIGLYVYWSLIWWPLFHKLGW